MHYSSGIFIYNERTKMRSFCFFKNPSIFNKAHSDACRGERQEGRRHADIENEVAAVVKPGATLETRQHYTYEPQKITYPILYLSIWQLITKHQKLNFF